MNKDRFRFAAVLVVCLVLPLLWVSGQSLWVDEGNAAVKAMQPTFKTFWWWFSGTRGSDLQMPLYMFLLWAWARIAGHAEWALRALNGLFAAAAMAYVAGCRPLPRRTRLLWCMLAAVAPFLAMYMDEARPYAMQFAAGALLFLPFAGRDDAPGGRGFAFGAFSAGLILLCGSSLTGVVYAVWPCLWLLVRRLRRKDVAAFAAAHWPALAIDAVLLAGLGAWYVHTLLFGARAATLEGPSLASLAFCGYEWFGFSGFGPSRIVLRLARARALKPFLLPLALYAAAHLPFVLSAVRTWRGRGGGMPLHGIRIPPYAVPLLLGLAGAVSMLLVGSASDMAIRARHLMPVFPAALLVVAVWADRMLGTNRSGARFSVILLLVAMGASSASFRFSPRHAKEDYRGAADLAIEALHAGKTVWWSADGATAAAYGVRRAGPGILCLLTSPSDDELAAEPAPDLVLVNRPDTWDEKGALVRYIAREKLCKTAGWRGISTYEPAGAPPPGTKPEETASESAGN